EAGRITRMRAERSRSPQVRCSRSTTIIRMFGISGGFGVAEGGEEFSPDDIRQAKHLGVPSYISTPAGRLFRYDPATGTTAPVLAMIPIEETLRLHAARNPLMAAYLAQRDQDQKVAANGNSNAR